MKRRPTLLLILLTLLFFPGTFLPAADIYPWKSWTLEPEFNAAFLAAPGEDAVGGHLGMGLSFSDLLPDTRFTLEGGYNFLDGREDITMIPALALTGAFRLLSEGPFSVWPRLGAQINIPVSGGTVSVNPGLRLGVGTDLRLWKRHYLQLNADAVFPVKGDTGPLFSLGFGIKHSLPLLVPLPEAEMELQAEPSLFSPDGDGRDDLLRMRINIRHPRSFRSWRLSIINARGRVLWMREGNGPPPKGFEWSGYDRAGLLVPSAADFTVVAEARDLLGNPLEERISFVTDVFVFEERGRLRIRVPGILFPPNSTDMTLLTPEEQERNRDIIARVAVLLKKFPEYRVRIEGHGNLMNWDGPDRGAEEQVRELIPLSRGRAAEVRRILVREGIPYGRVDVAGMGGAYPLVPFSDEQGRWENRRVEFILLK